MSMATHQHQTEHAGERTSLWEATSDAGALNPLLENTTADVCIVGAGIAGLSVAYRLVRDGQSVVVLDDGAIGRGMTARTTAHLASAQDDGFYEIESRHGAEGARFAAESHSAAIDQIEANVREEGIVPLEEAIRRLTSFPARNLRLQRRGALEPGYFADVVVFDPARIEDHATYDNPHQLSTGVSWVLVNGVPVVANGKATGAKPGRVLRGRGSRQATQ